MSAIKSIESTSVHKITSGQVVVDLQTAVKELLENSLDSGATIIEIRFKDYGLKSIEVIDNGSGISPADYSTVALKHHTSKLSKFEDLLAIESFGFRGEALSSLCALCETVTITTATKEEAPKGTILEFERSGTLRSCSSKVARQRGTTTVLEGLFGPLPVRRKELTRSIKREFAKALTLLNAYALYPCASASPPVRLTVSNQTDAGKKTVQMQTMGTGGIPAAVNKLWGPKAMDDIVPLKLEMTVQPDASQLRRFSDAPELSVSVDGYVSAFAHGKGRSSNDRQFLYINGRPCSLPKVQKAFNEVYKTFNTNQYPFIVANFTLPTDGYDVNVSPDKRTLFIHNEVNLVLALRTALEVEFSSSRSTFAVNSSGPQSPPPRSHKTPARRDSSEMDLDDDEDRVSPVPPPSARASSSSNATPLFLRSPSPALDADVALGTSSEHQSSEIPSETSAPATKRRRLSSDGELMFRDNGLLSSDLPSSPSPVITTSSKNRRALASISLRASPPPSSSSKSRASSLRTSHTSTSGGAQLTLIETFGALAGTPKKAVGRVQSRVVDSSEDEDEDELLDNVPGPSQISPALPTPPSPRDGVDEVLRLDPPVATPPRPRIRNRDLVPAITIITSDEDTPSLRSTSGSDPAASRADGANPMLEIVRKSDTRRTDLPCDLDVIRRKWDRRASSKRRQRSSDVLEQAIGDTLGIGPGAGIGNTDMQDAEVALSRIISKDDFREGAMSVIGQFNLGFIIARLRKSGAKTSSNDDARSPESHDDLFIIDQHASDEKFNFETLQLTTKIQSQSLLAPRPLGFSASDEVTAMEGLDVLKANGFEISLTEDAPVGQRLHLVAQPQSKSTVFDMRDLEELLSLMQDQPSGHMVRCSKARNMFASRACRKSVMIGKALTTQQMTSIIRQMATLDQPWSCPHGRPTMRHLVDLRVFIRKSVEVHKARPVAWSQFATNIPESEGRMDDDSR